RLRDAEDAQQRRPGEEEHEQHAERDQQLARDDPPPPLRRHRLQRRQEHRDVPGGVHHEEEEDEGGDERHGRQPGRDAGSSAAGPARAPCATSSSATASRAPTSPAAPATPSAAPTAAWCGGTTGTPSPQSGAGCRLRHGGGGRDAGAAAPAGRGAHRTPGPIVPRGDSRSARWRPGVPASASILRPLDTVTRGSTDAYPLPRAPYPRAAGRPRLPPPRDLPRRGAVVPYRSDDVPARVRRRRRLPRPRGPGVLLFQVRPG